LPSNDADKDKMHEVGFLTNIGVALLAALVGGFLARIVRLPVLIGYLIAGVVVGPHTPGLFASPEVVHSVANLGVALLMFAVGVHFSLEDLKAVRRTALVGGGLQIAGTIVLGVIIGLCFGWGAYGGLFLGCAIALSSTAVMTKILEERGEAGTKHGTAMMGILISQDLSLVLMVPLLPALSTVSSHGAGALVNIGGALLLGGILLALTLLLAMRVVPALMKRMTKMGSQELFLLAGICICLVAAAAAEKAGLGLALGSFLAGLVISETDYAHELFSQIRPLRDVFAAIFFVSVGMLLDPKFLLHHWLAVTVVVLAIAVGKACIAALAVYASGHHGRTAVTAGLGLAQIGEFSFVLANIGSAQNLIPQEIAGVVLSAALISLLITPFVFQAAGPVYTRLDRIPAMSRILNRQDTEEVASPAEECPIARVLILGYGRVGRYVSNALRAESVPHLVVDYDGAALLDLKDSGVQVIYGDASSPIVLKQGSPHCLELAIIALPEATATESAIRTLKEIAPHLPVVARVHRGDDIPRMRQAGADAVVHGEFEAGTEMIRQSLGRLGVAGQEIDAYLDGVRQHRYRSEENG